MVLCRGRRSINYHCLGARCSADVNNTSAENYRRWSRFSLRGLLLWVSVICLFLGWRMSHESEFQRIERRLEALQVHRKVIRKEVPPWRIYLFGPAIHTRFERVYLDDEHFRPEALEEIVDLLASWGGVREVIVSSKPIPRAGYEQIARLTSLERIVFDRCEPGDAAAMEPLAKLPNLREISIEISWAKAHPFPFDFYLSLPALKVLGLPSWSDEESRYIASRRPDIQLQITDFPP